MPKVALVEYRPAKMVMALILVLVFVRKLLAVMEKVHVAVRLMVELAVVTDLLIILKPQRMIPMLPLLY